LAGAAYRRVELWRRSPRELAARPARLELVAAQTAQPARIAPVGPSRRGAFEPSSSAIERRVAPIVPGHPCGRSSSRHRQARRADGLPASARLGVLPGHGPAVCRGVVVAWRRVAARMRRSRGERRARCVPAPIISSPTSSSGKTNPAGAREKLRSRTRCRCGAQQHVQGLCMFDATTRPRSATRATSRCTALTPAS